MFRSLLITAISVLAFSCSVQAADTINIPNRLTKAKKGEWVSFSAMGDVSQKQTITDIESVDGDTIFTISTEMIMEGKVVQSAAVQISLNQATESQKAMVDGKDNVTITEGKETVKGQEYAVVIVETNDGENKVTTYMSDEIPVFGLIRVEIDGVPLMEVEDFGE